MNKLTVGDITAIISLLLTLATIVWSAAKITTKLDALISAFASHVEDYKQVKESHGGHEVRISLIEQKVGISSYKI